MPKTTVGFSVSPELKERLNALFPPETLGEEKLTALIECYEQRNNNAAEVDIRTSSLYLELLSSNESLTASNDELIVYKENAENAMKKLRDDYNSLNSQVNYHNDMIKGRTGHIVLAISPAMRELVELVQARLSQKYGTGISVENILIQLFFRYNYDQWTKIFYPFMVKKSEIEAIFEKHGIKLEVNNEFGR